MGDVRFRRDQQPTFSSGEDGFVGSEQDENKPYRSSRNPESVSTLYAVPFVISLLTLSGLVHLVDQTLPSPLTFRDVGLYPDRFVAERAEAHLHRLTSFGPKVAGSYENEVLAVDYLIKEIEFTIQHSSTSQKIVFDVQKPTGSFHLAMGHHRFTSYYSGIQNIVVRLSGPNHNSSKAILVNCHFDTVPTSPGGSDDGINCAVMMEVFRILSLSDVPLSHDVIFLFNGAEENIMQASHGFISQHKWAKHVKAFINLEACGAGGKEILFQTVPNHPWVLKAYAEAAPHPHASVVAEEIFQGGLIPSDTDFRIFRDFGNLPGLDFAHARNGYVYHTKFDNEGQIPSATFQHTGDNVLALVRALGDSPHLGAPHNHTEGSFVFFDLFGFTLVYYSQLTGTVLNCMIVLFSVYTVIGNILNLGSGVRRSELARELGVAVLGPAFGWFLAFAWAVVVAIGLDWARHTMSWYSRPFLVVPLYFSSTFVLSTLGIIIQLNLTKQSVLCGTVRVRFYSVGIQLLWTFFLLLATLLGIRSAYLVAAIVVFPSIASALALWFSPPQSPLKGWSTLHVVSLIPPFLLIVYQALSAFSCLIPIMGRTGSFVNPELLISFLSTLLCLLGTSYLVPLLFLLRRPVVVLASLAALHLITLCTVMFTPLAFPFSIVEPNGIYPQRVYMWHVDRELYDVKKRVKRSESGFWMINMDRTSPHSLKDTMEVLKSAKPGGVHCGSELFCALPIYAPRLLDLVEESLWIPGPKPTFDKPISLDKFSEEKMNHDFRSLSFTISGPDHMGVMFSPKPGVSILGWNLDAELIPTSLFNGRPAYFIFCGRGLEARPFNISLVLKVNIKDTESVIDFGIAGHYMHNEKDFSSLFKSLLSEFPSWTHVTPWISSLRMWEL